MRRLAVSVGRFFAPLMRIDIWDCTIAAGAILFCRGLSDVYPPAALMAGGMILAALGWWWAPTDGPGRGGGQ